MKTTVITFAILFATILSANANASAKHPTAKAHQQQNQFNHTGHRNTKVKSANPTVSCDVMRGRF